MDSVPIDVRCLCFVIFCQLLRFYAEWLHSADLLCTAQQRRLSTHCVDAFSYFYYPSFQVNNIQFPVIVRNYSICVQIAVTFFSVIKAGYVLHIETTFVISVSD